MVGSYRLTVTITRPLPSQTGSRHTESATARCYCHRALGWLWVRPPPAVCARPARIPPARDSRALNVGVSGCRNLPRNGRSRVLPPRGSRTQRAAATRIPPWRRGSPPWRWKELSTAPDADGVSQTVRVTHPFHPLRGLEFRFAYSKHCWGLDRVFCEGEDGKMQSFPTAWTNFVPQDAFVTVSAGRSAFRVTDLLKLADFLDRMRADAAGGL